MTLKSAQVRKIETLILKSTVVADFVINFEQYFSRYFATRRTIFVMNKSNNCLHYVLEKNWCSKQLQNSSLPFPIGNPCLYTNQSFHFSPQIWCIINMKIHLIQNATEIQSQTKHRETNRALNHRRHFIPSFPPQPTCHFDPPPTAFTIFNTLNHTRANTTASSAP